jgi:hypothetical protein
MLVAGWCTGDNDQRPAAVGGPAREGIVGRPARIRAYLPRGAVRRGRCAADRPDTRARSGASESLVNNPAHTRSHTAATASASLGAG